MHRVRRLAALVLLTLWVPATLHCGFEAAGLGAIFDCIGEHHDDETADATTRDNCDLVETGAFRPTADTAKLPPPALAVPLLAFVSIPPALPPAAPPVSGVRAVETAPPEVARTWHFVARAAPPPRAPSATS